ncbi:MAG: ankyrin repeat domain-containing protein [Alphaproteobacteria bacterium]
MWQKIKDNLLTIAVSAYSLLWSYLIIGSCIYYKIYEINPNLAQKNISGNWNEVIFESVIFIILSFFLIFALIKKHKKKILKTLSYFLVPLIFVINIAVIILLINGHVAFYVTYGSNEQIKQILAKYNPNFPNLVLGGNVLHVTTKFGKDKEIIEFLINKGAKVNKVDYFGNIPLSYAVTETSPDVVELLVKNGADVNYQVKKLNNYSPLMEAIVLNNKINDKEKIVELLIKAEANINLQSSRDGRKVLDYATILHSKNKDEITLRTIELLLEAGANPFLKQDEKALSQYEVAKNFKNTELIELFEKYKKD